MCTIRMLFRLAALLILALSGWESAHAVEAGQPAPPFKLAALKGDAPFTLDGLKGRVTLIDFWASWCGPCREAMPQYDALRGEFPHDKFDVLAINMDEERKDAEGFLAKHSVSYPIALDPAGEAAKAFGLTGMPTSYLLDANGVVKQRHNGFTKKDIDELRAEIKRLTGGGDAH